MSSSGYQQGQYLAKVTGQHLSKSKSGNVQMAITFMPVAFIFDPTAGDQGMEACPAWERTYYRAITEKTTEYFLDDLETLGLATVDLNKIDERVPGFIDIRGQEIRVSMQFESYQGKQMERWSLARESNGPTFTDIDPSAMRQLNALCGKKLRDRFEGKSPAPKPVAVQAEGGQTTDDLPF